VGYDWEFLKDKKLKGDGIGYASILKEEK